MDRDIYFDIINQDSYGIEILESAKKIEKCVDKIKILQNDYRKLDLDYKDVTSDIVKKMIDFCKDQNINICGITDRKTISPIIDIAKKINIQLSVEYHYIAPEKIDDDFMILDRERRPYFFDFEGIEDKLAYDGQFKELEISFFSMDAIESELDGSIIIMCNNSDNDKGLDGCLVDLELCRIVEYIKEIVCDFEKLIVEMDNGINILTQVRNIIKNDIVS